MSREYDPQDHRKIKEKWRHDAAAFRHSGIPMYILDVAKSPVCVSLVEFHGSGHVI